jgi:uncharacterized damage-inducible protein DinB
MYHSINEFIKDWEYESEATLKVFKNLNNESLDFKPGSRIRTPGRLAWHLTLTISEMIGKTGLTFNTINEETPVPASAEEIRKAYSKSSQAMIDALKSQWSDNSLNEEISMYGETWKKEQVLTSLVKHQIHHRGQLTVVMRQAGLKVPGVYGPSYEEWSAIGMQPME